MRKLGAYLFVVLVLVIIIASFVEARERKYGATRTNKASGSKRGDVASGLDEDDEQNDDDKQRTKQFEASLDEDDDEDDEDDDEDDVHATLGDMVDDDSIGSGGAGQATFSESYTLDADGNKVYTWKNTERTTALWHAISSGDVSTLERMMEQDADVIHYRAEDGRGALFWAYEFDRQDIVSLLLEKGADPHQTDKNGEKPQQLAGRGAP